MEDNSRFTDWEYPEIEDGKLTKYNWVVQHIDNFTLGYKTDIGAFTYINAKYGVVIEDLVQIGSHCSIYSVSDSDPSMLLFFLSVIDFILLKRDQIRKHFKNIRIA